MPLTPTAPTIDKQWFQEIAQLRQNNRSALFRDIYFQVVGLFGVGRYAEALILAMSLYENLLQYFVQEKVGLDITMDGAARERSSNLLQNHDRGRLWQYLENYQRKNGDRLFLDTVTRNVLLAALQYALQTSALAGYFEQIEAYHQQRNDVLHQLAGLANIENLQEQVLDALEKVLSQGLPQERLECNPFKHLNHLIDRELEKALKHLN
ncbi:hypothetical protein [uncultured Thermosynechococcus sp.]|uniref:hypothetical protein n=1 Tax=uncultured Thermosynechococcus sp. TaxID=436945 RepID=UPI00261BAFEC|nr:hypothetical protein [uncultured Thermosynechococcus sp.]